MSMLSQLNLRGVIRKTSTRPMKVTLNVLVSDVTSDLRVRGESRVACSTRSVLEASEPAGCPSVCPDTSPARNPTMASTRFFSLPLFCLPSPRPHSCSRSRSDSGVKTRVSLYPASLRRSSRRSYVFEVPRRCRGTRGPSGARLEGYLDLPRGGV